MRAVARRVAGAVLLVGALCGGAAATARAAEIGMSDQQTTTWSDPRFTALGLKYARLIVPWDAATSEPAVVQAWLSATAAAGLDPHIAFEHLRSDHCPQSPCVTPSRAQYRAAVDAFIAKWPQVRTYTTWNEANHVSQPVTNRPEVVAGYWQELTAACPGCTIVAGDVLDSGDYVGWLQRFEAAAAPAVPQLWGLHNYGDVTYGTTTGTDDVLATVPGQLWIEETGGILTLRNSAGRITLSTNQSRATQSINSAFAIAAARPRIGRMYLYEWKAGTAFDGFDSGLINPDGTTRPSYDAVVANLKALAPAAAAAAAKATTVLQPKATAKWSKGSLLVTLTCPSGQRCRGRVTATVRTRATKTAALRSTKLRAKSYATTVAKRKTTLRLTVGAVTRSRVRRAAVRQLAVQLVATLPAATTTKQTLALKRR